MTRRLLSLGSDVVKFYVAKVVNLFSFLIMSSSAVWILERLKRVWFGRTSFAERSSHTDQAYLEMSGWDEESRFLAAFDEMAIGAALIASDGKFLRVNRFLGQMLGYSPQDLLSGGIQTITHPDEANDWNHVYHLLSKSADPIRVEKRYLHKLGHTVWANLTLTPIRNNQEKSLSFFSQFQDITEHKLAEESLRQSQLLFRGVIEGTPGAVFVKDLQGRYLMINSIGAKLHGKPINEIIGKCDADLFPIEEVHQAIKIDRQVMESGENSVYELAVTIDGVTRGMLFYKTPFLNPEGEIIGVVVVARDITENQRASENLENSRVELRALSARLQSVREDERMRIAREIHDELGQVLTGLKLDVVSLTKKISESVSRTDWDLLKDRSQEIVNLINNAILTVRKISTELRPGLLDAVGLTAAIEWQAKEFETRTGVKCKLKLSHEKITLDQHRSIAIFRIFQEILTNVARHSQATEVGISIEVMDSELFLEAKDNGRGIKANEFSNPKSLGLLGMRERALLLGGEVSIRGISGKGTTVAVRIPLEQKGSSLSQLPLPENG